MNVRPVSVIVIAAAALWAGSSRVSAQVISGESTYEDNFIHTPPVQPKAAPVRGKVDGTVGSSGQGRVDPSAPRTAPQ